MGSLGLFDLGNSLLSSPIDLREFCGILQSCPLSFWGEAGGKTVSLSSNPRNGHVRNKIRIDFLAKTKSISKETTDFVIQCFDYLT